MPAGQIGKLSLVFAFLLALNGPVDAGILTFNYFGPDFSGDGSATLPYQGSGETINAIIAQAIIIDDATNAPGLMANEVRVKLKLDPYNILGAAGISKLNDVWFNLTDDSLASSLSINDFNSLYANKSNSFSSSADSIQVGGAGKFDLGISFNQNSFVPGAEAVFDLQYTGIGGPFNRLSFLAQSEGGSIDPPKQFYSAIHLNLTGNGQSGHYSGGPPAFVTPPGSVPPPGTVPEPASMAVWSLILVTGGVGAVRRRRRAEKS